MPITICFLATGNIFLSTKLLANDTSYFHPAKESMDYPLVGVSNSTIIIKQDMRENSFKRNSLIVYNHNPEVFADIFARW